MESVDGNPASGDSTATGEKPQQECDGNKEDPVNDEVLEEKKDGGSVMDSSDKSGGEASSGDVDHPSPPIEGADDAKLGDGIATAGSQAGSFTEETLVPVDSATIDDGVTGETPTLDECGKDSPAVDEEELPTSQSADEATHKPDENVEKPAEETAAQETATDEDLLLESSEERAGDSGSKPGMDQMVCVDEWVDEEPGVDSESSSQVPKAPEVSDEVVNSQLNTDHEPVGDVVTQSVDEDVTDYGPAELPDSPEEQRLEEKDPSGEGSENASTDTGTGVSAEQPCSEQDDKAGGKMEEAPGAATEVAKLTGTAEGQLDDLATEKEFKEGDNREGTSTEGKENDTFGGASSDKMTGAAEPMETDEFDELERAVKEQSKREAEMKEDGNADETTDEKEAEEMDTDETRDTAQGIQVGTNSEDVTSKDETGIEQQTKEASEQSGEKDDSSAVAAGLGTSGQGSEGIKAKEAEDGFVDSSQEEKSQLGLTESQEMLLQYDGEDLLETMVSDETASSNQGDSQEGKGDGLDKSEDASGDVQPMEVDDKKGEATETEKMVTAAEQDVLESEQKEFEKADSGEKSEGPTPDKPDSEEVDVIDMIDEEAVNPSQGKPIPVEETPKEGAGDKNDRGQRTSSDESGAEKITDKSPGSSSDEKKRRSGGSSISSIVSRLTQSLAVKKPDEPLEKEEKAPPIVSQVKTVPQDTTKERQGRKQVYKKDEVFNRCSVCLNAFLSVNPIKFNDAVFCSDDCLHKKKTPVAKSTPSSPVCSNCKTGYKTDGAQKKFTLTVGLRERGFCSQACVSDYQRRVKPCSNCGEDIAGTNNAFMAQVGGDEGKFMEFCSQACVEAYEQKLKDQPQVAKKDSGEKKKCSMCTKVATIKHEVKFRGQYYHMCGTDCFASFRKKYNLSLRTCNQCGTTCYNEQSPGDDKEGHKVFFCSQKCLEVFQHSRSLSEPCYNCKTMFKQGMLIEGKSSSGKVYKFCSQDCLRKGLPAPTNVTRSRTTPPAAGPPVLQPRTTAPGQAPRPKGVKSWTDSASQGQGVLPCNHCKKPQRPLYHLTMSDSSLRNFCSYPCVIAFQAQFNVPPVTLPQETLMLKCGQCTRGFSHRPKTLDYQGETRLFCSPNCLDDFKKTRSVVAICDCCFEEKILYEETNFLGKARYFCSPGCSLIFKNQFVKRIGLCCAMCDYCSTMCKVTTSGVFGGTTKKKFCGEECKDNYKHWFTRMARCEGCKRMGCELTESFRWRGKVKRVCNEQCLLLFYTQQNVPDMGTQLQSELTIPDKTTQNGQNGTDISLPTICNVKSLAGSQTTTEQATMVKHIPMAHKQTQITTNTIFVKPPPPPPTPPPPAPKQVKNKITLCKPYAVSKGVSCTPSTKNEGTQADLKPVIVPIPVPIFVPVPMQMYTTPVPQPFPIPIPVPVPMFIPVAYNNCDKLMKVMEDIMKTIPSDPLEADILMMATAIAGKEEASKPPPSPDRDEDITDLLPLEDSEIMDIPADSEIAGMLSGGLESIDSADLFSEDQISKSLSRVSRGSSNQEARTRGAKRVCVEAEPNTAEDDDDEDSSPGSPGSGKEDVRPDIGPAAYSFYLQQISKDGVPPNDRFKADLTTATVDELHYCLCRFVKEATQPDGEMYPPDTLYLILLSIQKHLTTQGRKENIFMDVYFQTFAGLLHERLGEHAIVADPHQEIDPGITCLDEEFLWESKQLGAHTPTVLLSTLLYYMTKELLLKTAAMHHELAFSRVQKLVRKDSKGRREAYVRILASEEQRLKAAANKGTKRPLDLDFTLELRVNTKQPLRCPVKLYEFYLSKCPEVVKSSRTLFYLVPERACVPDSPLWYSNKGLPTQSLERYLWRHLMVKDIHEHWEMLRLKRENGSSDSE